MKRDNINYLAAGLTVVLAFALLFVVLYQITGRSGDTDSYHVYYGDVAGLRFGTPVYFEGYRIGQVEEVNPEREGIRTRFRVNLTVEEDWPIPSDTIAAITTAGLLSDVFIVLQQGESESTLDPGSEIEGREAADVFAALNDLAEEINRLTESELGPLLKLVNERVDSITGDLESGTPVIVEELQEMVGKLNAAAGNVQGLVGDDNLGRVETILENFEDMSGSARSLAEELRQTRTELDGMVKDLRAAVAENRPEVDSMVQDLALAVEGLSARMDNIGFNIDEAARNLNEFARAIRMRPNRLLFSPEDDDTEESE